jgi:hypothetical protein
MDRNLNSHERFNGRRKCVDTCSGLRGLDPTPLPLFSTNRLVLFKSIEVIVAIALAFSELQRFVEHRFAAKEIWR